MSTEDKREKRRLARLKKVQKENEILEAEMNDLLEDEKALYGDEAAAESIEEVKKDMGEMPMPPVTSFAELDAMKVAEEKAKAVRMVSYQAQDLVWNILYSDLPVGKKVSAMKKVADEFATRVEQSGMEEMHKSIAVDVLYAAALHATNERHKPLLTRFTDWLKKSDVETSFPVAEKWHSSVFVEKSADGKWRAVMIPSNNFIDWHGDILSEAAHLEYVEWVNKNMDVAPVFMTWHKAGTAREAPVDFVGYENGFLIMSAPLTDDEAAGLLRAQAVTDLGMSHTSIVLERDPEKSNVVTKYRMIEVTDLPLDAAANPFTDFDLVMKEASMDTKTYLAAILGSDEKAENFLKKTGIKQKELTDAEIPSKEKVTPVAPAAEAVTTPEALPPALTIEQVVERVSKEFGIAELSTQFAQMQEAVEKVPVLEALVKELSKSSDEKLAEMIQPPIQKGLAWLSSRPSQKESTVLTEGAADEKLKKSKPVVGWLSEATGTQPIQV